MKASKLLPWVTIYAIGTTILLSHRFVRDISSQFRQRSHIGENISYSENFHQPRHNASLTSKAATNHASPKPKFPIKTHVVTQGKPRTATTLLFNMAAVSYILYLVENDSEKIPGVQLSYWQRPKGYKYLRKKGTPIQIVKAHISLDNFLSNNTVVFTAAKNEKEAAEMRQNLERDGHTVAFVQDMERVKNGGVEDLVNEYVGGYGLSEKDKTRLNDYFSDWEILRQCCGQQMSMRWRNDMMPQKFKIKQTESHPTCASHDIDSIEQSFMNTELYGLIEKFPNIQPLNKPSLNDGNLNGTYCSSYNYLVRTQGLSIWGQPGGRPVRSKLDGAVKDQMKMKRENLKPEAYYLFPSSDEPQSARLRKMFKLPEKEKKEWLKAVLAARVGDGQKKYSDYKIPTTTASTDVDNRSGDVIDDGEEEKSITVVSGASVDEPEINENDYVESTAGFDDTRAIFLISFGEKAADSMLVERCILSLRRRGAWDGYIVVLTDASSERYQNEWDDRVIVMHPLEEHMHTTDGTLLKYSKVNMSLKPKRFKTFIIDYVRMNKRLDSVELVFYLDIDIMCGDSVSKLFSELERKYAVSREERKGGLSKLFFFTPISKEWPVQGGTFIVEMRTSRHCLELWRNEIDGMAKSGRGRDQDGLRDIYERIQLGEESKCELVRMENENFISFPRPRTFDKVVRQSTFPGLIHISDSVFTKRIDAEAQTKYIHEVLQLSERERHSGKYDKATAKPGAPVDEQEKSENDYLESDLDNGNGGVISDGEEEESVTVVSSVSVDEPEKSENDYLESTAGFDDTRAIFLISFGEKAADSMLVERCILSLRRRGAWDGYIVVLTDASLERYQNEWDNRVIVMPPLEEHMHTTDGTLLKYSRANLSLKPKRFKTFIIDYVGMNKRLDSVELVYYLDIDIMCGDSVSKLFGELERKYAVSQEERKDGLSKLFFFTPLSKEWPVQGGTFIVEMKSSRHCLELWRREIDGMAKSGRGRDQDGLRNIYQRAQSGDESKCELVRMENENFISFVTPRTFDKVVRQSNFPGLIHISDSVFAKWIDAEAQTKYIHEVLQLSERERQSGKYDKTTVKANAHK